MDKPNERSLHVNPTIRGGGVVFVGLSLLFFPFFCFLTNTSFIEQFILVSSILILASVSFLDDLYQLSAKSRFVVQCFVAILIALFMRPTSLDFVLFSISNQFIVISFIILGVIWAVNHFNFMDGLDGFCALQAVFLFIAYAYLFSLQQDIIYQKYCLVLVSCLIGFLIYNFPPAKLFMGDIGSASLGLISFAIAVLAQQKYNIPIMYWFALNAMFLFDSTLTLIRRLINKEKIFAAHRKHAYQRLKQFGISSQIILLGQTLLNIIFLILVAMLTTKQMNISSVLIIQLSLLIIIYYLIEVKFPMYDRMPKPQLD